MIATISNQVTKTSANNLNIITVIMMMTRKIVTLLSSFLLAAVPGVVANDCQTIYEIVCNTDGLEKFCGLIGAAELDNEYEQEDLTVFAPVNEAVTSMDFLTVLHDEKLREVVLFHVHDGALFTNEMDCDAGRNRIRMESGKDSRTICEESEPTWQKGGGNSDAQKPMIMSANIEACNGVIHMVDTVMLPGGFEEDVENAKTKSSTGTQLQCSKWYAFAALFLFMYL